jgi:2-dehydro-3-deoxygluconokinase
MSAVLCVGEALISLTPPAGTPLRHATDLLISTAGAEVNVAAHLARLGVPTRFAGRVGADPFGALLRDTLAGLGVDTQHLEEDPERPTGLYVKDANGSGTTMRYYRSASAATRYRQVPEAALEGVEHVHLTGITPALSEDCLQLVRELVALPDVRTSFDVNYRRALWSADDARDVLRSIAAQADTVFVGLDEADEVWGCRTAEDVRRLLPEPSELVVKDGAHEAVAFVGTQVVRVPAPVVEVVEPVGAGDAFAAGYLAAQHHGHDAETAVRWGHTLAGAVLRVLGDHAVTLDLAQLEALAQASAGHDAMPHGS